MTIKRILVALDGSEHANRALELAAAIASRFDAELVAMHAVVDKPLSDDERHMAEVEFQDEIARDFEIAPLLEARGDLGLARRRVTEQAAAADRRFRRALGERLTGDATRHAYAQGVRNVRALVREGDPATVILSAAREESVDLVALGRRGLGDLAGLLLGSVSHKVSHLAECACLTVK